MIWNKFEGNEPVSMYPRVSPYVFRMHVENEATRVLVVCIARRRKIRNVGQNQNRIRIRR
jgi:hypothetical protein